ncbi:MAG: tRNA 5-hydroxyuridine methyltransferase [Holosporales bacterium]
MKAQAPFMMPNDLQDYVHNTFCLLDDDLYRLKEQTDKMPERKMQITPDQGRYLQFLIQSYGLKDILEIGVYTGTSTLYMAKALPEEGKIIALDKNKEWTKIAQKYWDYAKVTRLIDLRIGDALSLLKDIADQSMDFVFIDADKKSYPLYYEESLRILRPNRFMMIDNIFMNGKVLSDEFDETVLIMKDLHKKMAKDERVSCVFLPFYDGMLLAQKRID